MAASNNRLSPRQRMINLMYIVLTAMLALNVSSDVLNGFTQVHAGLNRSNDNVARRNAAILSSLESFSQLNPDKGLPWYNKAAEVHKMTTVLYDNIDGLKMLIVQEADGTSGDVNAIRNRDDLEAASVVMLSPSVRRGEKLRGEIDAYREYICSLVQDSLKVATIQAALSTDPSDMPGTLAGTLWEEVKFDNQPVVAAVTLLTELQNDLMYAEGETLSTLLANVDAGDVRVNELNAFVIPQSRLVMRGTPYEAQIVLAAVDTTQRPAVYVNGSLLDGDNGLYRAATSTAGNYDYTGYLEVSHPDGDVTRHDFTSSYTVIDPTATVSATMMNVLYAGIDNPLSISVPGVAATSVSATMTNGSLQRSGDHWVARPTAIGQEAVVTVTATMDGRPMEMGKTRFRVRKLPDPTPFIMYKDAQGYLERYRSGSGSIARATLRQSPGIEAAIDDELLNISFSVQSFETVFFDSMGNAAIEVSNGASFSSKQLERFARMRPGQRFFISRVKATGPDGVTRDLAPIEVIVK